MSSLETASHSEVVDGEPNLFLEENDCAPILDYCRFLSKI